MHTMKTVLLGAALALTTVLPAEAQFAERTIRVSNGVNEEHPVGNGVAKMRACLADRSGGRMKLQGFWGALRHPGDGRHLDLAAGRHSAGPRRLRPALPVRQREGG
jgi:hypothetical protein